MNRNRFRVFCKRFFKQEDGLITVESVVVLPFLFWAVFASYTFFDSYRQSARSIKAAYAVADVISRERNMINRTYVDTMYDLMEAIVSTRQPSSMRVTFITYDDASKGYNLNWSCVRGTEYPAWVAGNVNELKKYLPAMPDNGNMIVVETTNQYRAAFRGIGFGFGTFPMSNFVFTHPRVFDQIKATDPC